MADSITTTTTRELEYYVDTQDRKYQIMYVVMSESASTNRGYPDVVFDYEEDAKEYKKRREENDKDNIPSFKRYWNVVRVIRNPRT